MYRYGLLQLKEVNIGDVVQSLAAKQFLPRVDVYVDREQLSKVKSDKRIRLIMNGWFKSIPQDWPPSPDIDPLFVSFHISPGCAKELTSDESIKYFKEHQPIGCRDYYTRDLLREKGVDAFFSGCLTLTLKSNITEKSDEILLVDLDKEAVKNLPTEILNKSAVLDYYRYAPFVQKMYNLIKNRCSFVDNLKEKTPYQLQYRLTSLLSKRATSKKLRGAERFLERYAKAKLVVTSRLHCALPCLAFGTPVVFVHKNLKDPRFGGLVEYLRAYSLEEFKDKVCQIDWESPEPNPKSIRKIREDLTRICKSFVSAYD